MAFFIPGTTRDAADVIVAAVTAFPQHYHLDFANVRALAVQWLEEPTLATATPLATALRHALRSWGAGKRLAAQVQPFATLLATLTDPAFIAILTNLRDPQGRLIAAQVQAALAFANGGIVTHERTSLYSQKALMLLAGIGPACDSQVRNGLRNLGLIGFSTPYVGMHRISEIILAADHWQRHQAEAITLAADLNGTVAHIVELQSPGRIMDILLFTAINGLQWRQGQIWAA